MTCANYLSHDLGHYKVDYDVLTASIEIHQSQRTIPLHMVTHFHGFLIVQNIHFPSAYSSFLFIDPGLSFIANVRLFILSKLPVRPKAYGPLERSKIGGFRTAKQPIRSSDFTESSSSHIIIPRNISSSCT